MIPRRRGPQGLALVLATCAATAGWAEDKLEPPDLGRYVRWGAFRVRPRVEIKDVGYDDNILASSTETVGDRTATIAPTLDGLVLFGSRAFVVFREQLEYTAYEDNSDQDFTNYRHKGRLTVPLGAYGLFTELLINRLKSRPADLEDIRPDRDEDGIGFGIILQPGARTEIEIGRYSTDFRHSDPDFQSFGQDIAERLDRRERRTVVDATYRFMGRTRLTLYTDHGEYDFDGPDPLGRSKDSDLWSFVPGIDFGEGGTISGSLSGGYATIDSNDSSRTDFDDYVGEASLRWRPIRRGSMHVEWTRKPSFSVYEDATYLLDRSTRLSGLYYIAWPVGIEAGIRDGKLEFPGSREGRVDDIVEYELGLRLRLAENQMGRRVEYSLSWTRWESDSNIDNLDRTRTVVGLGAVVGF